MEPQDSVQGSANHLRCGTKNQRLVEAVIKPLRDFTAASHTNPPIRQTDETNLNLASHASSAPQPRPNPNLTGPAVYDAVGTVDQFYDRDGTGRSLGTETLIYLLHTTQRCEIGRPSSSSNFLSNEHIGFHAFFFFSFFSFILSPCSPISFSHFSSFPRY